MDAEKSLRFICALACFSWVGISAAATPPQPDPLRTLPDEQATSAAEEVAMARTAFQYVHRIEGRLDQERFSLSDAMLGRLANITMALRDRLSAADSAILEQFSVSEPQHVRNIQNSNTRKRAAICADRENLDAAGLARAYDLAAAELNRESTEYYQRLLQKLSLAGRGVLTSYVQTTLTPASSKMITDHVAMAREMPEWLVQRVNNSCKATASPVQPGIATENYGTALK